MEDFEEVVPDKKPANLKKEVLLIVSIIFTVLVFRSSLYEPYRIPSGSMIPTLKIGDYIVVNKFAYGLKIPFSDMAFGDINLDPSYVFKQDLPKRGDVIVFKFPKDPSINYIKRVIGLPGDTIEIKDKVIYVNDVATTTSAVSAKPFLKDMEAKFKKHKLKFFSVKNGDAKYFIQQDSDNYFLVNKDKITIPKGELFVMGDNRDFSYDSRFWGTVPLNYVKGRAEMIWFSIRFPSGDGEEFLFRPSRIGSSIF
ncbi:putative signal peptidase I [Halobacteriovorax marinus SJ]|uniref:Signal peptidase I n=1 Tax=Halobacteriovorax marinus (strain ATCC BAA-682 / DSM 15412 / SJ) TaxID=862908 RepID=E1X287_HALMS|nr:signal peptidase I [Halobacteriovorax marinus]CBW25043.1 putative signal peptidase I [Halobacteriovorax marinus SJ]